MKRIDIKIGYNCNNKCAFCVQGDKRYKFAPRKFREISAILRKGRRDGMAGVVFTGGEPTLHPDLLSAVRVAKKAGYRSIQLQTNGRMLSYENYCKKLITAGVNEFSPALHGSYAGLHDKLVGVRGAWSQVMRGMGHLKRLKQRVITNTVITELNYKDLPQIAHLLAGLGVSQMHFSFIHICGTAQKNRHWIVPKKSNAMPFIKEALAIARAARIPAYTEAIPFCLMDGYEECISENIMPDTMIVDAEGVTQNYTEFRLHEGKAKAPKCKTCIRYKQCEGPWREYIELYGWREFKPIKRSTKK